MKNLKLKQLIIMFCLKSPKNNKDQEACPASPIVNPLAKDTSKNASNDASNDTSNDTSNDNQEKVSPYGVPSSLIESSKDNDDKRGISPYSERPPSSLVASSASFFRGYQSSFFNSPTANPLARDNNKVRNSSDDLSLLSKSTRKNSNYSNYQYSFTKRKKKSCKSISATSKTNHLVAPQNYLISATSKTNRPVAPQNNLTKEAKSSPVVPQSNLTRAQQSFPVEPQSSLTRAQQSFPVVPQSSLTRAQQSFPVVHQSNLTRAEQSFPVEPQSSLTREQQDSTIEPQNNLTKEQQDYLKKITYSKIIFYRNLHKKIPYIDSPVEDSPVENFPIENSPIENSPVENFIENFSVENFSVEDFFAEVQNNLTNRHQNYSTRTISNSRDSISLERSRQNSNKTPLNFQNNVTLQESTQESIQESIQESPIQITEIQQSKKSNLIKIRDFLKKKLKRIFQKC